MKLLTPILILLIGAIPLLAQNGDVVITAYTPCNLQ